MYIAIEMKVGVMAFGVCKIKKDNKYGYPLQNLIIGKIIAINENQFIGHRNITIEAETNNNKDAKIIETLPEWRVSEFDFGGVPMPNPWFDQLRIEAEDAAILTSIN